MHAISALDCRASPHAARVSAGGLTPSGMARHTQAALTRLSSATSRKALRQPSMPPIHEPSGMPTTDATDQPRNTKVMARPRCCAGTSSPTQAAACGVKMAGDSTASTRTTNKDPKLGMKAHKPRNTAYQSMDSVSRRRRSQPATRLANSGAPRHITTAAAAINWPATATEMFNALLMSLSVPGTTITPVPMTKLPNSSGQSTLGSGWVSVLAESTLVGIKALESRAACRCRQ